MIEQRVTLRYGAQQIPAIVQAVQGDTGRDVIFELADYEIPAGSTANYYIDKPDGNAIYNSAEVISSTEILAHLTEQALAEPGRNNGQVRILSDGEVITSFDFVLEVEVFRGLMRMQSETEVNIFDEALQNAAEDAIAEIQAQTPVVTGMQNSIAPTYSASSTYAVGDYVMYNAQLYRCITAITASEAWTAAHWTQVQIASDVSDLKSTLDFYTSDLSDEVEYINTGTGNNTPSTYSFGFWLNIDADRLDINPDLSVDDAPYTVKRYSVTGSVASGSVHTLTDTITNVVGDFSLYNIRKNDIVTVTPNSGYSKSVKVSDTPNGIGNLINISPTDSLTLNSSYRFAGTYTIYTKTLENNFNKLSFDDGIMSLSDLYGYNGNVFYFIPAISSKAFPSSALNSKLEDFESVLSDNNLATITYPIRVRNSYGIALGDIKWNFPTAQGVAKFAVGYDVNGVAIGRYTDTDLTSAEHGIPSNVYYMSFIYYTTVDYQASLEMIKDVYIVDVNGSGDYDSLTECFTALKDNNAEKTIYVLGGEYDIYEEMGGADYFNNIPESATWLSESVFIPPNSHVIGLGKVTIKMILPTTIPAEKAIFFSPVNIDRSATLENVNIVNLNNRYSIHIEGSKLAQNDNQIYKLKNVRCYRAADTSGVSDGTLVCGLNKGTYLDIENCQFISDNDHSIGFHDQSTEYDLSPSIHISDCVIVGGTKCCNLASTVRENMETVIDTVFSNCYLSSDIRKIKNGTSSGTPKDVFKVVLLNTDVSVVNAGVTDEIVTEKYPPTA